MLRYLTHMSSNRSHLPLGVFDSGLGGLTVVRALREALPGEDIIYLGDTARVPYGTKAPETVVRYSLGCARTLVARDVKAIVVACNTAVSAVAPERLRIDLDLPVIGVVDPGARAAVAATRNCKIGVIGTSVTVSSGAYVRAVAALSTRCEVVANAAPLLVPLAEEGWVEGEVPRLAVRRYLEPLAAAGVDVIVLGCTHYPLLRAVIEHEARAMIGEHVRVVDSAHATASDTAELLRAQQLLRASPSGGNVHICVTDVPRSFSETATRFLGTTPRDVEQIDLVSL